ncbi:MAG: enoyl-CoA hydratase [Gammaproteobacteria bacterium]
MGATANDVIEKPTLLREDRDGISTLILNRPQQYNPLSSEMLTALQQALDDIAGDDDIRVIIIGAQGRAFCAGHDLKQMRSSEDRAFHQALFEQCSRMMLTINQISKPVIARVNGIATAAGCQLVAACDLAVVSEESQFAVSGINVGLFCSTPAVPLSRNLSRKRAMQMLLTGDFIDAQTALDYGLVNQVVAHDELEQATRAVAQKIVAKSPLSISLGKQMFYRQLDMELAEAYEFAGERMTCNMDSEDAREGIDAFIDKRKARWSGK